jgi:hypothetical protein
LQGSPSASAGTVVARESTPPLKQTAEIDFFSSSLLHRRRRRDLQNNKKTQ